MLAVSVALRRVTRSAIGYCAKRRELCKRVVAAFRYAARGGSDITD